MLPLLLVGCGRWGSNILRDLAAMGRPAIVVDISPPALAAARPMALATFSSLDVPQPVGAVIIATPATEHLATVEDVARFDVPIFVEKPLSTRTQDSDRMLALAGERLFVMEKWRYHPGVEALAGLARSGELGSVRAIRTWRLAWGHSHQDVDAIWTLLPHDLSIVHEILGYLPEAIDAIAERGGDHVCGMTARLGKDPTCTVEVSSRRPEHRRRIEVVFGAAVAVFDGARETTLEVHADTGLRAIQVGGQPPLRRELEAFVGYLDGGPPPKSSGRDGAAVVRLICELRRVAGLDP